MVQNSRRQDTARALGSRLGFNVKKTFDNPDVFFGASVEASDDEGLMSTLANDASIARVWPLRSVKLIKNVDQRNFSEIVDAIDYNIHGPTGVEAMHKAGILGEGATVAVVDTGIDYTHPGVSAVNNDLKPSAMKLNRIDWWWLWPWIHRHWRR
jgi:subtilisin family serine protease